MIAIIQPGGEFRQSPSIGGFVAVKCDQFGNEYWCSHVAVRATHTTRQRWNREGGRPDNYDDFDGLRVSP